MQLKANAVTQGHRYSSRVRGVGVFAIALFLYLPPSLVLGAPVAHVDTCAKMKQLTPEELGALRSEFLAKHNDHYSIELDAPSVRNQCSFGGCWAYSSVADLEQGIFKSTGKKVDLSEQYLIAMSLLEQMDHGLDFPREPVIGGNFIESAERLVRMNGLVPSSAWSPRIPFETAPHGARLLLFLNNRIAQYHLELATIPTTSPARRQLREKAQKDLRSLFDTYMGPLPTTFEFEGKTYTPQSFGKELLPPGQETVEKVYPIRPLIPDEVKDKKKVTPAPGPKLDPFPVPLPVAIPLLKTHVVFEDWDKIETRIIDSLKAGKAVPFGIEYVKEFADAKTGILSISAFHVPEGFESVPVNLRQHFGFRNGAHAMDIIGVDLDEHGKIIKLKVRNSWDTTHGDKGVDHMYVDYFRAYLDYMFFR